jgi:hypothetical protein
MTSSYTLFTSVKHVINHCIYRCKTANIFLICTNSVAGININSVFSVFKIKPLVTINHCDFTINHNESVVL